MGKTTYTPLHVLISQKIGESVFEAIDDVERYLRLHGVIAGVLDGAEVAEPGRIVCYLAVTKRGEILLDSYSQVVTGPLLGGLAEHLSNELGRQVELPDGHVVSPDAMVADGVSDDETPRGTAAIMWPSSAADERAVNEIAYLLNTPIQVAALAGWTVISGPQLWWEANLEELLGLPASPLAIAISRIGRAQRVSVHHVVDGTAFISRFSTPVYLRPVVKNPHLPGPAWEVAQGLCVNGGVHSIDFDLPPSAVGAQEMRRIDVTQPSPAADIARIFGMPGDIVDHLIHDSPQVWQDWLAGNTVAPGQYRQEFKSLSYVTPIGMIVPSSLFMGVGLFILWSAMVSDREIWIRVWGLAGGTVASYISLCVLLNGIRTLRARRRVRHRSHGPATDAGRA